MRNIFHTIQGRTTWLAGLCLIGVACGLIALSLYQARQDSQVAMDYTLKLFTATAKDSLQAQGRLQAMHLQSQLQEKRLLGEGLSRFLLALRDQNQVGNINTEAMRRKIVEELGNTLSTHTDLLGVFVVFQKNDLDGADAHFKDNVEAGSNEEGRFAQYLVRNNDAQKHVTVTEKMMTDLTAGPSGQPYNAFFTCSQNSQKPCILEPYVDDASGQSRLVTSITYPLMEKGRVIAIIGFDIDLVTLQQSSVEGSRQLLDGKGRIRFLSSTGLLTGDSNGATDLGTPFSEAALHQVLADMKKGQSGIYESDGDVYALTSLAPFPGAQPWGVLLNVSGEDLLAPAQSLEHTMSEQRTHSAWLEIGVGGLISCLGMLVVSMTARGISKPINSLAAMLEDIADGEGDLTRRLNHPRSDELGRLAQAFNHFLGKLQPSIAEVQATSNQARLNADQSAVIARQTSDRIQQQFHEIDMVATAIQEMSATAYTSAQSAASAADAAGDAGRASHDGFTIIEATSTGINSLAQNMNHAMEELQLLARSNEQIGTILEVIQSIASQTNLLALNAAIEAARAGESGRGFAVVADEVRGLAQRTQSSVEEIRGVIESLQARNLSVTDAISKSHHQAQNSVEQARQAISALSRITAAVDQINEMNLQIASAAEEQSSVSDEVGRNISAIRDVTQAVSDQAEETARLSQQLNKGAELQHNLLKGFKV
ncbi:methyl-accepting chemotaxis protein [Pseudomonas sp. TH49]|uniref:methyl-accepting chemotaxis protein n=2 Tax=Pseudomonas sp. TH49 TaxID=2796413 RepID=UPI0019135157|nr:methyl-accepting chemotaxis protein [Pseudomonas sp. TH49]MBK5344638.1 methyl-accepting chemotaxis protein [Pseudomonas sp. TH49]